MNRTRLMFLMAITLVLVAAVLRPAEDAPPAEAAPASAAAGELNRNLVLVISVDGLTKRALKKLGPKQLPNIFRLLNEGASTMNARTQPELTTTLPNHVSMVTGRRIDANGGGHGVTWNYDDRSETVHSAAGEWVESVFNRIRRAGGTSAVFATKDKFSIFNRTWPNAVNKNVIRNGQDGIATWRLRQHLRKHKPTFSFLHLGGPDRVGHARKWMSPAYRRAVRRSDELIGKVLQTRDNHWRLRRNLAIIFTSDHGGVPWTKGHYDSRNMHNFRVPFAIHARYVDHGRNLYSLSPTYERPGWRWYPATGAQPIRNGDVANASLAILGLGPVRSSLWGYDQQLKWR